MAKNIEMNYYDGNSYEVLYPCTTANQVNYTGSYGDNVQTAITNIGNNAENALNISNNVNSSISNLRSSINYKRCVTKTVSGNKPNCTFSFPSTNIMNGILVFFAGNYTYSVDYNRGCAIKYAPYDYVQGGHMMDQFNDEEAVFSVRLSADASNIAGSINQGKYYSPIAYSGNVSSGITSPFNCATTFTGEATSLTIYYQGFSDRSDNVITFNLTGTFYLYIL